MSTTIENAKAQLASWNNPEAPKKHGMVYQCWEDGEITLQKSGELLWQRNLHCMENGFAKSFAIRTIPKQNIRPCFCMVQQP